VAIVAIALVALLGSLAVAVDLGRVATAAQRAQDTADAAALAGILERPSADYTAAGARAHDTVIANNVQAAVPLSCGASDVTFQTAGATIPNYGVLAAGQEAVTVDTYAPLHYFFAPALGLNGTTVHKRATCVLTSATSYPVSPIWIAETTPLVYNQAINLMASGPHYPGIPGSFGWLTPPTGSNDFEALLEGYDLEDPFLEANAVGVGQVLNANAGAKTGQWTKALGTSGYGRLARGTWPQYATGTFTNHLSDDPRILVLPVCRYLGGTGSGAQFQVVQFAAFWLESASAGGGGTLTGRFIEYVSPGQTHGGPGPFTGIWTTALVN